MGFCIPKEGIKMLVRKVNEWMESKGLADKVRLSKEQFTEMVDTISKKQNVARNEVIDAWEERNLRRC